MRICLRRAAHISANGYANGHDKDTDVVMDIGVKSVCIRAFWPREISQSTSLSSIQCNISCYIYEPPPLYVRLMGGGGLMGIMIS